MIPQELRPLFWDINIASFEPASYPDYTIARVLEYGDEKAVGWMRAIFDETEIKRVLRTERRLTARSANFWALVYDIAPAELASLRP